MQKPLLLTLIFSYFASHLVAQTDLWKIDINEGDQLKGIIEKLSSRQDILIAYPAELSNLYPRVAGRVQASTLPDLLADIFPTQLEIKELDDSKFLLRSAGIRNLNYEAGTTLKGKVVDLSGKGISDILIFQDGENAVLTNDQGDFTFPVAPEKINQKITFQGIGYLATAILPSEVTEEFILSMVDAPLQLDVVKVVERIPSIRSSGKESALKIKNKNNRTFTFSPLYASDIIKQIQLLPGVSADDDLDARIKIRGSEGNESLVLLDGIPVYRTDHFYGIFSSANANYFSEGSLYKNALPAQYGGRTGGLLSLRSGENTTSWQGTAEIDLLTASISLFTPINEKISWNFGARSSYLNAADLNSFDLTQPQSDFYQNNFRPISRSETISTDPLFNFQDLNSKIIFRPNDRLKLNLNFFGSSDRLKNNYDVKYSSRINRQEAISTEIYRNSQHWENLGSSLNIEADIIPDWKIISSTFLSSYRDLSDIRSLLTVRLPQQEMNSGFSNLQEGRISSYGSLIYLFNQTENQELKFGIDYKYHRTNYSFTEDDLTLLEGRGEANQFSVFSEKLWGNNKPTSLILGGRTTYYSPTERIYLDPKIQINHETGIDLVLKGSIHFAHQFTREINYENRLGQTASYLLMADGGRYPVGTSLQYMLGFNYQNSGWNLDVELYQKNLEGVLEYSLQRPGFDPNLAFNKSRSYRVLNGKGKILGMDFLLSRTTKNYTGWIAYTLSKSTRQFREVRRNQPFPAENDRRHQLKWINAYNLGKFTLSANYIFSSGKPYLALDELPGQVDQNKLEPRAFIRNLPSYQRLDLGIDYHFNLAGKKATIGLACFNITDYDNVKYLQYIYSVQIDDEAGRKVNTILGTETSLLGRTPNLKFRLDF